MCGGIKVKIERLQRPRDRIPVGVMQALNLSQLSTIILADAKGLTVEDLLPFTEYGHCKYSPAGQASQEG